MQVNNVVFDKPAPVSYYKGEDVKAIIAHVVSEVETMVTSTMGPNGKLAVISYGLEPKTTKDGVTVAKSIKFTNEACEFINRIVTEPALKTDEECGDGTTTTIFLTKLLYDVMVKHNSFMAHKAIEHVVDFMVKRLEDMAIGVTVDSVDLYNLALTSANNDPRIANVIIEAYKTAKHGYPAIELKPGRGTEDVVSPVEGLPLRMQFANAAFSITGCGENSIYKDFTAVGVDAILSIPNTQVQQQYTEVLVDLGKANVGRTVLLVCRSVEIDFCNLVMQVNKSLGCNIIPVNTGLGGSLGTLLLGDILTALNGQLVTSVTELNAVPYNACESSLVLSTERGILTDMPAVQRKRIQKRIDGIQRTLDEMQGADRYNTRARFNEQRVRDLQGELITIYVGGETTSEIKERVDRFEDVNKAVRSALVNGVLPGCGSAMRRVGADLWHTFLVDNTFNNHAGLTAGLVHDLAVLCYKQYYRLFKDISGLDQTDFHALLEKRQFETLESNYGNYINIATGAAGDPSIIGVFDTAYASITALKGGLKTAKILAQTDTILLGSKLGSQRF